MDIMEWIATAAYIALGFTVLFLAKLLQDVLTPYRLDEHLTAQDNPALGLSVAGYLAGVLIVFLGATAGGYPGGMEAADLDARGLGMGLLIDGAYAMSGVLVLNFGRVLVDKVMLPRFSTRKEIIEDRNIGVGAVEFGSYIATALVVAGAIQGHGGPLTAIAAFALGQVTLLVFAWFYQLITPFDLHQELERDNVAAGVVLSGGLVGIGIILWGAVSVDFIDWPTLLQDFGVLAVVGFVLLAVMRYATDKVLLPHSDLRQEIAVDRNLAAAFIEGGMAISIAAVIVVMT